MGFQRNHPPLHLVFVLAALLGGPAAWAGAHYAPQTCSPKELELLVINPSAQDLPFWVQVHSAQDIEEKAFEVPAQKQLRVAGTEFLTPGMAFAIRQRGAELSFFLKCRGLMRMNETASPRVQYDIASEPGPFLLRLQNLHHTAQNVQVSYVSADGFTLHDINLPLEKNYVSTETWLRAPTGTRTILIEGEARLSSQLLVAATGRALVADTSIPVKVQVPENRAYFLAANDSFSESYVVPIDDPVLLAKARAIVAKGSPKITVAEIEPSPGASENRDLLSKDGAPWSWRVKTVLAFSDIGHQDCSGSPGYTEDFKEAWMPSTRAICYWTFRLKRELTPEEVSTGRLRPPSSMRPAPAFLQRER